MADITLSLAQRDRSARCAQRLLPRSFRTGAGTVRLSFIDFISEKLGPVYYNAGIEAIRTHLAWSERIQEEMDLKKIL